MQYITIDITHALILIIPIHGIFLSLLCINKSRCSLSPNFYQGLLLFVYSSLAFFQIIYPGHMHITLNISYNYFLCDVLIIPFIFLYNSIMIQPDVRAVKRAHLLIISFIFLLFSLTGGVRGPIFIPVVVFYLILNGLYLAGSVRLLTGLIRSTDFKWKHLRTSPYCGIIVFNLLVAGTVIISTFINMIFPESIRYLTQLMKAPVIYYVYYQIMRKADFVS